jgi:DNA-directed RNA polymerase specialized sigma subunit
MPRKKQNYYFTQETENYIVAYNRSQDSEYRAKIFTDHIYYPFYKLAENIIHTFKFYYTEVDDLEDLKHEIVTVLLEDKIHKFDPNNGAKAYSYFQTIVKRWLINYNDKNYKKVKKSLGLDSIDLSYDFDSTKISNSSLQLSEVIDTWVESTYAQLTALYSSEQERKVADAILTLFKTRKDLAILKKKALYIYVREITKCDTPVLTSVITKLKRSFYEFYEDRSKDYYITLE